MNRKSIQAALIAMLMIVLLLPLAPGRAEAAVPKHSESFYVNDFAGVIDEKTENYMVNYGVKLHQKTGAQVVLVTVKSTNGVSMEDYATSLFNSWGVGSADKNNGLLLLLSIQDDDYWAVPGKGLETELNSGVISKILSASLEPDFAAKKYSAGAHKTYGSFIQKLGGSYSETIGTKNYVSDNAGVFKQVTKDYLNQSSNRYAATTGSGIYVVTIKDTGGRSLKDYTYAKFAGVAAGPRDVMLVLDIGGDNYHVLQGKSVDRTLTNELIGGILDEVLEPKFAAKDYASGATGVANAFHSFFLARADAIQGNATGGSKPAAATSAAGKSPVTTKAYVKPVPVSESKGITIMGIFLILIALISLAAAARNRYIARYGIQINPHNPRNIRRYGAWTGQPGYGYGQRRTNRRPHHHSQSSSSGSSSGSFWGSNSGGGGSSSGGGAGRYSSRDDDDDDSNRGGGGSSSGGGAGRYSSYDDDDDNNSGGGGSASSGGGVGRNR
ncbi:TPM domain-containing protein [Paenibacillus tritici]|uniref:TPM domain-containing protein n=1 Tax=Paenibacillus tritici TaxID=1873425 RepID=UPI001BA4FDE5|nr:TPM domain-containing protein [Paenibacillus tritici]QUL57821.1 TPM domain-containing protein [Paenibacillus tritici]